MAKQTKPWPKDWIKDIASDFNKVTLFPLQLANCDRLEKNNAVYIFDEVDDQRVADGTALFVS